jgi:hypothetical protein
MVILRTYAVERRIVKIQVDFSSQYGYPPDLQDTATDLVLMQAELLAAEWVAQT